MEAEAQDILWQKIQQFEFDDPDTSLTFSERLARENGWTIEYALRAIFEYKKFIFLVCISNQTLTPSDQVDQVWHLHLIYTKSYWLDFCGETLGRQIHHGPTKGGGNEANKYFDLYKRTKDLYEEKFKIKPPVDIWPPGKMRFKGINFQRVNLDTNWIIKKRKLF